MSSVSSGSPSSGRKTLAIVLAVLAVILIVVGLVYVIEPAKSLPSFMGAKKPTGHHEARMAAAFVVGVLCAAGAWISLAYKPKPQAAPQNTMENTPAGQK